MTNPSLRALLGVTPFVLAACGGNVVGGGAGSTTVTLTDPGPDQPPDPPPYPYRTAIAFSDSQGCFGGGGGSTGSGWGGGTDTGTWTTTSTNTGTGTWTTGTWGAGGGNTGTWGAGGGDTGTWGAGGGSTGTWGGAGGGTGGGGPCGAGMLTLELGNPGPTCSDPAISTPCGSFGVSIGIPPELQHPGTIPLSAPGIVAYFSETGAPYGADPTNCPGGGGSFDGGVLVIQQISSGSVIFNLSGTQPFELGAPSADGLYNAVRCD